MCNCDTLWKFEQMRGVSQELEKSSSLVNEFLNIDTPKFVSLVKPL